jgi:hypothetical protein
MKEQFSRLAFELVSEKVEAGRVIKARGEAWISDQAAQNENEICRRKADMLKCWHADRLKRRNYGHPGRGEARHTTGADARGLW